MDRRDSRIARVKTCLKGIHPKVFKGNALKIAIVGCGRLGRPCGEVLAQQYDVVGYDVIPVEPGNFTVINSLDTAISDAKFILIAVPTPHEKGYSGVQPTSHLPPRDFDYTILKDTVDAVLEKTEGWQIVVVISTVLPGTMRRLFGDRAGDRLIYNPYLIAIGSVKADMRDPDIVIMGTRDGKRCDRTRALIALYEGITEGRATLCAGTWEEAEAIKIFYNTFISSKIALANMILDVSMRVGNMNVDVVTQALGKSTKRITSDKYLVAGMGDGGACHPRDNIALSWLAQHYGLGYDLFGAINEAREAQAQHLARYLIDLAERDGLPIVIMGKAYKPGVAFTDGSYSLLIAHFIEEAGAQAEFEDPQTGDRRQSEGAAVFLLAHNAAVTYGGEDQPSALYCDVPEGSIVVDPWRTLGQIANVSVIHYGNTRFDSGFRSP